MLFDGEKRLAHQREKHRCVCERHIGGDERGVPSPEAKPYLIQRGGQYCDQERKRLEKTREKSRREKEYRGASERQTAKRIGEESGRNRSRSAGDASGFAPNTAGERSCAAASASRPVKAAKILTSSVFTSYEYLLQCGEIHGRRHIAFLLQFCRVAARP